MRFAAGKKHLPANRPCVSPTVGAKIHLRCPVRVPEPDRSPPPNSITHRNCRRHSRHGPPAVSGRPTAPFVPSNRDSAMMAGSRLPTQNRRSAQHRLEGWCGLPQARSTTPQTARACGRRSVPKSISTAPSVCSNPNGARPEFQSRIVVDGDIPGMDRRPCQAGLRHRSCLQTAIRR